MNNTENKPIVLTFIGNYLPGFKAGGILRSMVNTVDHLCDKMDFWIITRDRDLGDNKPYHVKADQWQRLGNSMIYYVSPLNSSLKKLSEIINETNHDIVYLNSFFEPFTVKFLFLRKLRRIPIKPVIVSPRGEFAWASLRLKYLKKIVFIYCAKLIGLYNNTIWHASSIYEEADIKKVMGIREDRIEIALDLPGKLIIKPLQAKYSFSKQLRLVFISRISREKNLDFAIKVLNEVNAEVAFDVYGPAENMKYWKECLNLAQQLPSNIQFRYMGILKPEEVTNVLSGYDLLFFPSGGENYGHVIAESLSVGTPVLISDKTPWKNLEEKNFGWDMELKPSNFVKVINNFSCQSIENRHLLRDSIISRIQHYLVDPDVISTNRQLFLRRLD